MIGVNCVSVFQLISLQQRSEAQIRIKEFNLSETFLLLIRDVPRGTNNLAIFPNRFCVRLI